MERAIAVADQHRGTSKGCHRNIRNPVPVEVARYDTIRCELIRDSIRGKGRGGRRLKRSVAVAQQNGDISIAADGQHHVGRAIAIEVRDGQCKPGAAETRYVGGITHHTPERAVPVAQKNAYGGHGTAPQGHGEIRDTVPVEVSHRQRERSEAGGTC